MTRKGKAGPGKRSTKKLKLKKETIKDLDAKGKRDNVRGGRAAAGGSIVTCTCFSCIFACKGERG